MNKIKSLLANKEIIDFTLHEYNCALAISEGYSLCIDTLCRFIGNDRTFISAQDHGHQFGLDKPFDAEAAINNKVAGEKIIDVNLDEVTGDLSVIFSKGKLEIICSSIGYESYQIYGPNDLVIVGRSGETISDGIELKNSTQQKLS